MWASKTPVLRDPLYLAPHGGETVTVRGGKQGAAGWLLQGWALFCPAGGAVPRLPAATPIPCPLSSRPGAGRGAAGPLPKPDSLCPEMRYPAAGPGPRSRQCLWLSHAGRAGTWPGAVGGPRVALPGAQLGSSAASLVLRSLRAARPAGRARGEAPAGSRTRSPVSPSAA